jgi:uncharacterized protein YjiS (DUF1127 family)
MSSIDTISGRPVGQIRYRGNFLITLREHLVVWRRRYRTRLHLLDLSDYELEDLGLSRAAAREEAMRPFWESGKRPRHLP